MLIKEGLLLVLELLVVLLVLLTILILFLRRERLPLLTWTRVIVKLE